jgi:FkbM family methyltransferase
VIRRLMKLLYPLRHQLEPLRPYIAWMDLEALAPKQGWAEVQRQGLNWRLRLDHSIDREIYINGAFEVQTTALLKRMVLPQMYVVDVGANIGYHTTVMANIVGPKGRVWAFEPLVPYRQQLEWHLGANKLQERVTICDFGLSDKAQTLTITSDDHSASLHHIDEVRILNTATQVTNTQIQLKRLDDVVQTERLDFIKLDIDGHEPFFLRGAEQTIRKHQPMILIEFANLYLDKAGFDAWQLRQMLEDLGYQLYYEKTERPFQTREEFLLECGNYKNSANVWCVPRAWQAATLTEAAAHAANKIKNAL